MAVSWLPYGTTGACSAAISVTGFGEGTYDASLYRADDGFPYFTENLDVGPDGTGTMSLIVMSFGPGATVYAEVDGIRSDESVAVCAPPTEYPVVSLSWVRSLRYGECHPVVLVTGFARATYEASLYAADDTFLGTVDLEVAANGIGISSFHPAVYELGYMAYVEVNGITSSISAADCIAAPHPDPQVTLAWTPASAFGACHPVFSVTGFTPGSFPLSLHTDAGELELGGSLVVDADGATTVSVMNHSYAAGTVMYAVVDGVRSADSEVSCLSPTQEPDPDRTVTLEWIPSNSQLLCYAVVSVTGFAPGPYSIHVNGTTFPNALGVGEDGTGTADTIPFGFYIGTENSFAVVDGVESARSVVSCS